MPTVEINDLDKIGAVRDEAAYMLPPEALTRADNMRVLDGALVRMSGNEQTFGSPPVAPHYALPISTVNNTYWLYASLAKIYAYDGVTHTNLTRQTAGVDVDYSTPQTRDLNGTILAGIPIINNGVDPPQYWGPLSLGQKMQNLANWPSGLKAKKLIAFGAYLIGINFLDGSDLYSHLVRWSSSVQDPGSLPGSWDYTDPTNDSGAYDLPDVNSGVLLEAAPLQGRLFLYKEQSTWAMRRSGGLTVFSFDSVFETMGVLAPRCVAIIPQGTAHVVATQDDLIIHNGSGVPKSILDKKLKKEIFRSIDATNYLNSFCHVDPEFNEVWFCYPENGQVHPNRAVVLNVLTGAITEADVAYRNTGVGTLVGGVDEVWDAGSDTWDTETGTWDTLARRRLVLCDPANTRFLQNNKGLLRAGLSYNSRVQRVGLALLGKKRSGEWIVDHEVVKFVDRLWPKIRGGPIQVRIGFQDTVDGPISWREFESFDPTTMMTADFAGSGRAVAVDFYSDQAVDWKIDGYKINVKPIGRF